MNLDVLFQRADIWRGGETPSAVGAGIATGFAALDALLPGGGWPRGALTEVLAAEGSGALSLLMPALAQLCHHDNDRWIAFVAPPHLPYPQALAACGINLARILCVSLGNEAIESPIVSSLRTTIRGRGSSKSMQKLDSRFRGNDRNGLHQNVTKKHLQKSVRAEPAEVRTDAPLMESTDWPLPFDKLRANGQHNQSLSDQLWALEQCLRSGACAAVLSWFAKPPIPHLRRLQLAAETGGCLACLFYPPQRAEHTTTPAALRLAIAVQSATVLSVHVLKRRGGWPCGPVMLEVNNVVVSTASAATAA